MTLAAVLIMVGALVSERVAPTVAVASAVKVLYHHRGVYIGHAVGGVAKEAPITRAPR
jgi:hypothetical protein